jgi:hypothetical protein
MKINLSLTVVLLFLLFISVGCAIQNIYLSIKIVELGKESKDLINSRPIHRRGILS